MLKKKKREEEIIRAQNSHLRFNPEINRKSHAVQRGFIDLVQDTNRRLSSKHRLETNLRRKEKLEQAQICSKSDIVLHDRFDTDF